MGSSPRSEENMRKLDPSKVPEGMDVASTYELELRFSSETSRKDLGYYVATEYVDSERTNLMDFKSDLYKEYPWTPTETAHLSYYDGSSKSYVSVRKAEKARKAREKKRLEAIESGTKRKKATTKKIISSKRLGTAADRDQIEATPTNEPASGALVPYAAPPTEPASGTVSTGTRKGKKKANDEATPIKNADSPAMGTRSKTKADSPATGTRSKKKLLDILAPYLKSLNNISHDGHSSEVLIKALKELSCIEDLEISPIEYTTFHTFLLQSVCRACPRLKKLKLRFTSECAIYMMPIDGRIPVMHELRFLELLGCELNAMGLAAILDSCPVLQSLRITGSFSWGEMNDELKAKCARVKNLNLPEYHPLW
ncbi:hypothetical protein EJB05_52408, partial [Eragrostis curvula]